VVDIRGFTVLAQKIDAGVLGQLVSTWFAEVDRIVRYYGGTAQKHIGDAVMAVWPHAVPGNEPVEILRILWAVADIARMTGTLHEPFDLSEPVRIGAGVNTGLAALGNTGAGSASDFTAIGDSVNVAFRLESATKELGTDLVLGATTFDYLRGWPSAADYFRTSEAKLKGYDAPVKSWQISFGVLNEFLIEHQDERVTTKLRSQ
jgi:adenylate cyclase